MNSKLLGYVFSFLTILIWSNTYIFTVRLLEVMSPLEILFFRFLIAFLLLSLFNPSISFRRKDEWLYALLGFLGVTLYYYLENMALQFTRASNVGLIVSIIPIFTAMIAHYMHNDEKFRKELLFGFAVAMTGIAMVILNGKLAFDINPVGDLLALLAAAVFALYSNLLKKTDSSTSLILVVKKIFFYGIVTMIPLLFLTDTSLNVKQLAEPSIWLSIGFLSLFASIAAFFMWHSAIKRIGATKTTSFIYWVPVVTMVSAKLFLDEEINSVMIIGAIVIVAGVYYSENSGAVRNIADQIKTRFINEIFRRAGNS